MDKEKRNEQADHPQAVELVDSEGHMTKEGIEMLLDSPSKAHDLALREQINRQILFGRRVH